MQGKNARGAACVNGTDGAVDLAALYRQYREPVLRRIRRFHGLEESEDILQEVFARAAEKASTFRGDSAPSTWLWQIVNRYCMNHARNHGRRQRLFQRHQPDLFWSPNVSPANQEAAAALRELWRGSDRKTSRFAQHYYAGGMTQSEIAEAEGCSRRTVGHRLHQFKREVRQRVAVTA